MMVVSTVENVVASQVSIDIEKVDKKLKIISICFGFTIEGDEIMLAIQRAIGDPNEDDGLCIVISPSQQCAYNEVSELVLDFKLIKIMFTLAGQKVFNTQEVQISFSIEDRLWTDVHKTLLQLCDGLLTLENKSSSPVRWLA